MSTTDIIEQADALIGRGVNRGIATELVAQLGTDNVKRTVAWFDSPEQRARGIGAGVLVSELRAGGRPGSSEPAAIACPTTPELETEWVQALAQFDDDFALVWGQRCHPHRHDAAGWTLGAEKWVLGWIPKYLPAIRRELGERVHIVQCGAEAAQSITPGTERPLPAGGSPGRLRHPSAEHTPTTEGRRS